MYAFGELESNGIGVNTDFTKIFGNHMLKYIYKKKIYQNYNFFTTTSRPSNSIHNLNFAALTKDQRKAFSPLNDVFVEFDFNAAELRVLLGLLGQEQPAEDIHIWISKNLYESKLTREQSKKKVFSWLYNPKAKNKKLNEYFDRDKIYKKYYDGSCVYTPFHRRIKAEEQKAVNYLIQSTSSDMLLSSAIEVHNNLKNKKSFVSFCIHDSIVVDLSYDDRSMVEDLAKIFSSTKFGSLKTNLSIGKNFGNMKRVL